MKKQYRIGEGGHVCLGYLGEREVKFQMMIEEIWEATGNVTFTDHLEDLTGDDLNGGYEMAWLSVFYQYDELNSFGRVIMARICYLDEFGKDHYDWQDRERMSQFIKRCEDIGFRMRVAKAIMKNSPDKKRILFLFWAMMILAVYDEDKEERLSFICDFARMFKVSDEAMIDMAQLIRLIFGMEEEIAFKDELTEKYLGAVARRYGH